jgi:hypothetical protein
MQLDLVYDKMEGFECFRLTKRSGVFVRERYYHWKYWYQTR